MIFQIDFTREENERKKSHVCVKKELNHQSNNDEQQKTNRDIRWDQIFFFENKVFIIFKHKNHVSRNK